MVAGEWKGANEEYCSINKSFLLRMEENCN
jgi:hypothetical protein